MSDESLQIPPSDILKRVRVLVSAHQYASAHALLELLIDYRFQKSMESDHLQGLVLSFKGLLIAGLERRHEEGLGMCKKAAQINVFDPECFLNLARVHLMMKDKPGAYLAIRQGLKIDSAHSGIRKEMQRMGLRKASFFNFLPRDHAINIFIGKMRYKVNKI